jgi:14-3-3 protein epsilon
VSWRIVSSLEQREGSKGQKAQVSMMKCYREKIEIELAKIQAVALPIWVF